ncbi:oxidoreductase, short-chain dehydrogenase family, putative [Plasmodium vivax]|uniref:Oxidoreductase, short-chain dehydrogenase family, putative n=3 Tax=Plasmodium vivax TaxID=5855 RepID=A5K293_PLAVS|nr:oxidoreductase, short-chain dehydrogenase family, putative [Plasmodium vivax]EDL46543.1 oxidoreductase, short-chain dehydrogenase family, putative [Plasmodium vivax]KMZ85591.1 short-chain dehydrogenase family oxidoreductase [Plasmodium vivax Brazil I]KMZ98727.1 short-chain dehydrogenase family oxidoreductase [Plasmodium vivax North Korean]|eukprot:XP_001616270.1 oxidoreductase, short-chain dehydrogenase family [Plasmodium vivax Sal-1]
MEVKNKARSFLGVILIDPSLKRFLIFILVSGVIWFLPLYKVLIYVLQKKHSNLSSVDDKIYECVTNISVILTYYYLLCVTNVGGTSKRVMKNAPLLRGKCVIVTGGYKGIGLAAVTEFVKLGCEVVLACRSVEHMEFVKTDLLTRYPDAKIHCVQLDLASYKSVESCASQILSKFPKIDILVNNAGFVSQKLEYVNGLERTFFINYLGHFYLTKLLHKRIVASDTLVVNLSSIAHSMLRESDVNYNFICEKNSTKNTNSNLLYRREYNFSKLCMLYYTQQLQRRFENEKTKACTVSINPGLVRTELFRNEQSWFRALAKNLIFSKSPLQGAQTILYVCLLDREKLAKGSYYSDCKVDYVRSYALDLQKSEVHPQSRRSYAAIYAQIWLPRKQLIC